MRWMEMTWPDFEPVDSDTLILWPLASCEQHGHHMPVGTDTVLVTEIAERIERALPEDVLLLPTLWLGASNHHRGFPGTVSLSEGLYSSVLQETLSGIIEGPVCAPGRAKRILVLNGHGGNFYPGNAGATELSYKYRERADLVIGFASYWTAAAKAIGTVPMETPQLTHACEYETAMMLATRGELVHMERANAPDVNWPDTRFTPDASRGSEIGVAAPFHARSANGTLGSPELATADKGRALLDAIATDLTDAAREMLTWPDLSDARP